MVDNTSSMGVEQQSLATHLPRLLSALSSRFDSIQVGVVTSDMGAGGFRVPSCLLPDFGDDGLLRTEGSSALMGCDPMYPSFLTWTPGSPVTVEDFGAELGCLTTVGVEGCGFEQPLEALLKALTPAVAQRWTAAGFVQIGTGSGGALGAPFFRRTQPHGDGPNVGFVRDDSVLAIVVVTDEEDCSARDANLFDPDSRTYPTDLNLRCFAHAAALHSIDRYVEGFLQLRRHPSRLVYAVIAGVPPDLLPHFRGPVDWDRLISPDLAIRDVRMQERVDPSMPNRLVPSCNVAGRGVAFPPIRMLQTARALESRGARVGVGSICQDDYVSAFAPLLAP
jgi:hypothetical protein